MQCMENEEVIMGKEFIRQNELAKLLGVSAGTIWRWRQEEFLPKPFLVGKRFIAWKVETIEHWLISLQEKVDD